MEPLYSRNGQLTDGSGRQKQTLETCQKKKRTLIETKLISSWKYSLNKNFSLAMQGQDGIMLCNMSKWWIQLNSISTCGEVSTNSTLASLTILAPSALVSVGLFSWSEL